MKPRINAWRIVLLAVSTAVAAWACVATAFFFKVTTPTWIALVTFAAFASEAVVWAIALALGLKVVEARHRLFAWIKRPFVAGG